MAFDFSIICPLYIEAYGVDGCRTVFPWSVVGPYAIMFAPCKHWLPK